MDINLIKIKRKKNNFNYCVVGIGRHARHKIIPALEKSGKKIIGIVSRTPKTANRGAKCFQNIDLALNKLPKDTIFVISTPPQTHFKLLTKILEKKRDVIVEKPIFTEFSQAKKVFTQIKNSKNFVFEAFMYKHTLMYKKFKNHINTNINNINWIELSFTIPKNPKSTFREDPGIQSSCLYDMGCYIIDLFVGLKLILKNFEIVDCCLESNKIKFMKFIFFINSIEIRVKIGIEKSYNNFVKTCSNKNDVTIFHPFFYGRKGHKNIDNLTNSSKFCFYDKNAFETMFKLNRQLFFFEQRARFTQILKVNKHLEDLSKKILKLNNEL